MSKTNLQTDNKKVYTECDCGDFGICDVEDNRADGINIGLFAFCDQSSADGFFQELRDEHYPNSTGFFECMEGFCRNCLRDYICDNDLSVLFVEDKLLYEGVLVQETGDIISFIGELLDCEVYFVREKQEGVCVDCISNGINIRGIQYENPYKEGFFHAGLDWGIRRAQGAHIDFSLTLHDLIASPDSERRTNFNIYCEGLVAGAMATFEEGFDYTEPPLPEPTSEHIAAEGGEEEVIITMNWIDGPGEPERVEKLPPLHSKGILRTGEWDVNVENYMYTDHVFFRDYASNNLIYVWLTDRDDEYPNNKPSEVMDYLHNDVLGDCIFSIEDMLKDMRNTAFFIDCLGGLAPEMWFTDKGPTEMGIDIHNMSDQQILETIQGK